MTVKTTGFGAGATVIGATVLPRAVTRGVRQSSGWRTRLQWNPITGPTHAGTSDHLALFQNRLDDATNVLDCFIEAPGRIAVSALEERGGKMLPAISADLPAYLLPPTSGRDDRQTTTGESEFGPAVRVNVSSAEAIAAQSRRPGEGLYGPDGRFIEGAARRELENNAAQGKCAHTDARSEQTTTSPHAEGVLPSSDSPAPMEGPKAGVLAAGNETATNRRHIDLASLDAVIPPAARAELNDLADRVSRKSDIQNLGPDEYRQLADLMSRVGRYDKSMEAQAKADELEGVKQSESLDESPRVLDVEEQEAGAAEDS